MAGKNTAVFGIYPNYASVERGVDSLKEAGFRNTDISVLLQDNRGTRDFAPAQPAVRLAVTMSEDPCEAAPFPSRVLPLRRLWPPH